MEEEMPTLRIPAYARMIGVLTLEKPAVGYARCRVWKMRGGKKPRIKPIGTIAYREPGENITKTKTPQTKTKETKQTKKEEKKKKKQESAPMYHVPES